MYARFPTLARRLFTLAAINPDGVAAVAAIEDGRRPGMLALANALAAQGYLREAVSIEEAADLLTVITSFQSFDELFTGSGLAVDVVADRLIALAERSVCRPGLRPEAGSTSAPDAVSRPRRLASPKPAGERSRA